MVDGGRNPTRMMSLSAGQKIVSATFKTGSWLDSVTFKLNTGKTFKIGRNGGSKEETDNIPAKSNYRWRLRIIHQWRLFEELGFDKELRVKGDVLADQAAYLLRCGFDSFDCDGEFDAEVWERTTTIMTTAYQRSYDDRLTYKS